MRAALASLAAVALLAILATNAAPAAAQTTFSLQDPQNDYPKSLVFRVTIESDQEIKDVTLRYTLKNRNASGFGKPAEFTPGTRVETSVVIETNPDTNWLPVGNEFVYEWEAALADGSIARSPQAGYFYLPPGRDWKKVGNDLMTVYYFGERTNTANRYLAAAADTYAKLGQAILETRLESVPVKVVLFVDPREVTESQPTKGQSFEAAGIVVCGYRPGSASDIIIVSATCGGSSVDTLRHEFAHILTAAAGEGRLVNLPSWLDEGLAVMAQEGNEFASAYRAAIRRQELLPFERMGIPASDPNQTLLFYGQSAAMAAYLIDTYGAGKMAELMRLTKADTRFDVAFKQVFGFDMRGFESEFRAANGLPPAAGTPAPAAPAGGSTPAATAPANQSSGGRATPAAGPQAQTAGDSDGPDVILVGSIAFAVLATLAAAFFLLLSQLLAQRRATAAAAATPPGARDQPPADGEHWRRPPGQD